MHLLVDPVGRLDLRWPLVSQGVVSRPVISRRGLSLLAAALFAGWLASIGQAALAAEGEDEIPKPEDISLKTDDGLDLKATFYPTSLGKKEKKDAVPVIILHAWKGDRGDCQALAEYLQEQGHAVIIPDLRGHGQSTQIVRADGTKVKLNTAAQLKLVDFQTMVTNDMETIKSFLLKLNNDGELNIEKLCVIGAEMGAVVAIDWAAQDWAWPVLATGKQGQDVKAVVAISPEWNFKGLGITSAMADPAIRSEISFLIIAGKGNAKAFGDAKKLYETLERFHTDPEKKDLFFLKPETKLQGTKLLNEKSLNLNEKIGKFIELRLVNEKFPWAERVNPLNPGKK
jgi:pimeloyl-ACP methyl ester carboxylesterase